MMYMFCLTSIIESSLLFCAVLHSFHLEMAMLLGARTEGPVTLSMVLM